MGTILAVFGFVVLLTVVVLVIKRKAVEKYLRGKRDERDTRKKQEYTRL